MRTKFFLCGCLLCLVLALGLTSQAQKGALPKCLYIASYHQGYFWQDGIEKGLRPGLAGKCALRSFYMDAKRHPSPTFIQEKARQVKDLVHAWKPDVVIASDDIASKYVIQPYFADSAIPIVFCGVNWTVEEYGYPYPNVTGMIEVPPIKPLLYQIRRILPEATQAVCLIPNRLSEQKACLRYQQILEKEGIVLRIATANSMAEFASQYRRAQQADFILLSNNSIVADWNDAQAKRIVSTYATTLSATVDIWMTSYVMLGITQIPEEQGAYAASVAGKFLEGVKPSSIPIIPNRQWNLYLNTELLPTTLKIPYDLFQKAEKIAE